jgi:hypothetical protein
MIQSLFLIVFVGGIAMDFVSERGAVRMVSTYVEHEMPEYRRVTEKELNAGGIAPEARAAFSRKPYYGSSAVNFKNRPVLR